MGAVKKMMIEATETVIDELNLDDSMQTFYDVGEIIDESGVAPHELSDIEFLKQEVAKKLCPHCLSTEGHECSCFALDRL